MSEDEREKVYKQSGENGEPEVEAHHKLRPASEDEREKVYKQSGESDEPEVEAHLKLKP